MDETDQVEIHEELELPGSLFSRLDLLFIVLDYHDPRIDATIADHVLRTHRWRGHVVEVSNGVFVQPDPLLHGADEEGFLTLDFLKKYIGYAKQVRPVLTEGAKDEVVQAWAELRTIEGRKSLPLTPRAFETLIRLATANAKLRLSDTVTEEDSQAAISLVRYAIFGEVEGPAKKARKATAPPESSEATSESEEYTPKRRASQGRRGKTAPPVEKPREETDAHETEKNIGKILEVFQQLLKDPQVTIVKVPDLKDRVEREKGLRPSDAEMGEFLDRLLKADKIMLEEDVIYPL
jgi:DNA replication licensing factor MCM3